jgi:hypothetical protein
MKKILYLTDYYYPNPTSIGVCGNAVIQKLLADGYFVDVLCFGIESSETPIKCEGNLRIYTVKDRLWERLIRKGYGKSGRIICRLSQFLMMHWFPMTSITVPNRFSKMARNLHEKNHYTTVVSSYAPFEACWAGYKIKQKNPDIEWDIYVLDTFTNRGASRFFSREWNDQHGWYWEKKFFEEASKVILLKCHEKHHGQNRYNPYRKKFYYVDIPLYDIHKFDKTARVHHEEEKRFVYTGRIDTHWYSPVQMAELFLEASKEKDWKLYFFGNPTDCENYLDIMQKKSYGKIVKAGFVSRETVEIELKNADVLVSYCHKDSDMIQSKIFDYMSTGNKIIHLTDSRFRDSARLYYEQYPNALILNTDSMDKNDMIKKIVEFTETDELVTCKEMETLFVDNRPEATARVIEIVKEER